MGKNKRIALIFNNNDGWIAGTYYITNLIHALSTLPQKPHLLIYTKNNDVKDIETIKYPSISYHRIINGYYDYPRWKSKINSIFVRIFKKEFFDDRPNKLNVCFPNVPKYCFSKIDEKYKVFWIPDFQEDYLPQFFSNEEVESRKKYQTEISETKTPVIFSSFDALNDFKRLYPNNQNKTFVLQFAVTHPRYQDLDINLLLQKYNLPKKYFFAPNQFWKHKNHFIILESIKLLVATESNKQDYCMVFSGKEEDYRNPDYFASIKKFVLDNNLFNYIHFLGFIDRKEQLQLMKNAISIVQPSLFEGWSTVVEDAKAMNAHLICSDLKVHREQNINNMHNTAFFDPYDAKNLADCLKKQLLNPITNVYFDYNKNIEKFGNDFLNITNHLS